MAVTEAPFDEQGNMLPYHQPHYRTGYAAPTMGALPGDITTLKVVGMYSGRSAKGVLVEDDKGRRYQMFVKDLIDILMAGAGVTLAGPFEISKRGANYGIRRAKR